MFGLHLGMSRRPIPIKVKSKDLSQIRELLRGGIQQVRVVLRALSLRRLADGFTAPQVAQALPLTAAVAATAFGILYFFMPETRNKRLSRNNIANGRRGARFSVLWRASARHLPMTARPWAEAHGCTLKRAPLGLSAPRRWQCYFLTSPKLFLNPTHGAPTV
jgi:hypothetical protein